MIRAYRMRAEAMIDVGRAIVKLAGYTNLGDVTIMHANAMLGDVEVLFTSASALPEIVKALARVFDGHVMVRTVAPAEEYTGDNLRDESDSDAEEPSPCDVCGEPVTEGGDGYDGMCGGCADKAAEGE